MLNALIAFASYLAVSVMLLLAFIFIYERFTPYREFELIAQNNTAAAITLSGAILGFCLPLVASIYYTQSLVEMMVWAAITCVVQLVLFTAMRKLSPKIQEGHCASATVLATLSVALGLLNAVSISH